MAFAFVQTLTGSEITGTGTYTTSAFGSSLTVGNTIIAIVTSDGNTASQVTGVTDSKGNTYTKDAETVNTLQSTERYISIWRAPITTGGASATITVTYNGASSNNSGIVAQEWSSGGAFTLDKTAGGGATVATASPTTATTAATTVAAELVVAGFVSNSTQTSFTAGTGYSNAGSIIVSNANAGMESKTVAATGTQVATATLGTARAYGAIIATYSEASSAVNVSITQVHATLTATGGTQSFVAVSSSAIAQLRATLTATGGTQVVAAIQKVAIAQAAATLTATGGTQTVATIQNVALSQSAAAVTASGQTQVVSAVVFAAASVSQLAASVTATGGTQAIARTQIVSVLQAGATLAATGGQQLITAVAHQTADDFFNFYF